MLGIRKFKSCKIDLWVGRSIEFDADILLSHLDEWNNEIGKMHVAVLVNTDVPRFMEQLKLVLQGSTQLPRRVSCILSSKDLYLDGRKQLELLFEDLDD